MLRKLLFTVLSLCTLQLAKSQSFHHGVGTGALISTMKNAESNVYGTLMYNPRVSFAETENSSISVGIPLSVGIAGSYNYNSYDGSSGSLSYMVNAPLMVNFNYGAGSSDEAESRFGFFAGAGFGINHGNWYYADDYYGESYSESQTSYGPAANAGVRFAVGNGSHNIEVLLSYMKGLNEGKPNIFGIQGVFNF